MSTFTAIAGSPRTGITVLKKDGGICRLEVADMAALAWKAAPSTKKMLAPYAALTTSVGTTITTLAVQDAIEYISSFNSKAEWKKNRSGAAAGTAHPRRRRRPSHRLHGA